MKKLRIKRPIAWAQGTNLVFFGLLIFSMFWDKQATLFDRLFLGVVGIIFIFGVIKLIRGKDILKEDPDPTVKLLLIGLLYIVWGGCAFSSEMSQSLKNFDVLFANPMGIAAIATLPVGVALVILSILDIYSND